MDDGPSPTQQARDDVLAIEQSYRAQYEMLEAQERIFLEEEIATFADEYQLEEHWIVASCAFEITDEYLPEPLLIDLLDDIDTAAYNDIFYKNSPPENKGTSSSPYYEVYEEYYNEEEEIEAILRLQGELERERELEERYFRELYEQSIMDEEYALIESLIVYLWFYADDDEDIYLLYHNIFL